MKRSIQYLIALLVVVAAAYILFVYGQQKPTTVDTATSTTAIVGQMTVVPVQESTDTYTIDATYPQFGIPSVDAAIKSTVDAGLNEFRSYPPNPPDSSTPKNSLIEKFDHVYQGPDVVSVSLLVSEDTGGQRRSAYRTCAHARRCHRAHRQNPFAGSSRLAGAGDDSDRKR